MVLGYIANEIRRFYVYVSNRVEQIRKYSSPDQCQYVPIHQNPADVATRPVKACNLQSLTWLSGPPFLKDSKQPCAEDKERSRSQELQPDDPEVRSYLKTLATTLERTNDSPWYKSVQQIFKMNWCGYGDIKVNTTTEGQPREQNKKTTTTGEWNDQFLNYRSE